jgi:radical SAM superfamily enzyme YgiQ (UPF0313 family)
MPSPQRAFAKIKYFYDKGVRHFAFYDDHFMTNKKWFFELCDLIEGLPQPIRYFFVARIDSVNEEVISRAYKTGARIVGFGIENLSNNTLKIMNKKITVEQIWQTLELVGKYNMQVRGGILVNSPDEKLDDIGINIHQHKRMRKYLFQSGTITALEIYPGTTLEAEAKLRGQLTGFSWVKPYFNEYNYVLHSSPYTPLFFNLDFYKIVRYIVKESICAYDSWLARAFIRRHIFKLAQPQSRSFLNKFKERYMAFSGIIWSFFSDSPKYLPKKLSFLWQIFTNKSEG